MELRFGIGMGTPALPSARSIGMDGKPGMRPTAL